MASVTVALTGYIETGQDIQWLDNASLGSTFDDNNQAQTLDFCQLFHSGFFAGRVALELVGVNRQFTPAFEASGRIIFEASDGEILEVQIADADTSEPYFWLPANSAEVITFANHVRGLTNRDATLTLADNFPPVADAGPAQTVDPFETVTLDATGSNDADDFPAPLTYAWTRISGPAITLINPDTAQPTFEAPALTGGATYIFQVVVSDGDVDDSDTVTITLRPLTVTLTATPSPIDHAGTTALTGALSHTTAGITQRWASSAGGTFSAQTALATNWTAPSTVTLATVVDLTLTVRLAGVAIATKTIQVVVRAQTSLPLALPAYADQMGATGNTVDLTIASATDGRAPYSYAYADLPEELGAIGRRIRGRPNHPWHRDSYRHRYRRQRRHSDRDVRLDSNRQRHPAAFGHQRENRLGA